MFRLFADINQCKHTFFAGCHDAGYLSMLTPYRGMSDRITLLKGASFHPEFRTLGLSISEMPSVFMSSPLGESAMPTASKALMACKFFQKVFRSLKLQVNPRNMLTTSRVSANTAKIVLSNIQCHNSNFLKPTTIPMTGPPRPPPDNKIITPPCFPPTNIKSEEYIPVNKDGHRIDTYLPQPPNEDWLVYNRRAKQHKLCNAYHLGG